MEHISLYQWAKNNGVSYSRSQTFFENGELEGAYRTADGKRVLVPADTPRPAREMVTCAACGKELEQISLRHLIKCSGIESFEEYHSRYPNAVRQTGNVRNLISEGRKGKLKGVPLSAETRAKMSEAAKRRYAKK